MSSYLHLLPTKMKKHYCQTNLQSDFNKIVEEQWGFNNKKKITNLHTNSSTLPPIKSNPIIITRQQIKPTNANPFVITRPQIKPINASANPFVATTLPQIKSTFPSDGINLQDQFAKVIQQQWTRPQLFKRDDTDNNFSNINNNFRIPKKNTVNNNNKIIYDHDVILYDVNYYEQLENFSQNDWFIVKKENHSINNNDRYDDMFGIIKKIGKSNIVEMTETDENDSECIFFDTNDYLCNEGIYEHDSFSDLSDSDYDEL
jgi:hypothetical protein